MSTETATTTNGSAAASAPRRPRLPYESVGDFLSNTKRFKIIESTLREGEQFANAFFDTGNCPLFVEDGVLLGIVAAGPRLTME